MTLTKTDFCFFKLQIYDCLDLGRRIDVNWPSDEMRACGGRSSWRDWTPQVGMVGYVVHYWQPNHPDLYFRSNVNRTLLLLQIGNHFVPVGEAGVKEYHSPGAEVVRGQTVSAENLSRRGRGSSSRSRKSDSIRKLKSEEDPVMPVVVVLAEEDVTRCDSGREVEEREEGEEEDKEKESPDIIVTESKESETSVAIQDEQKEEEGESKEAETVATIPTDPLQMALVLETLSPSASSSANIDEELARVRE